MPVPTKTNLIGVISTPQGILPFGTLKVSLGFDAMIPSIGQVCARRDVTFTLDSNGALVNAYLWSTALMNSGSIIPYYRVTALTAQGQIALGPIQVTLPNVSSYDVSNWLQ